MKTLTLFPAVICCVGSLMFSAVSRGQESCASFFVGQSALSRGDSIYRLFQQELRFSLIPTGREFFERITDPNYEVTAADRQQFQALIAGFELPNQIDRRELSRFLGREVSTAETIVAQLARAMGRYESGQDQALLAFSGNYTEQQIRSKDRILEVGGFTIEDRVALLGNKFVDDVLTNFYAYDLFENNTLKTTTENSAMNEEVIRQANALPQGKPDAPTSHERKFDADDAQARDLYELGTRNPVARLLKALKYDPEGTTGFCFGRAMTLHLEALRAKFSKLALRKVWVEGTMNAGFGRYWRYHVAFAIRASDGGWWVLDPFAGKPLKLEAWYAKMKTHDESGMLRLYMTEASRFGPLGTDRYSPLELKSEAYRSYFVDLMKYFRETARTRHPNKNVLVKAFDWALSAMNLGF